VLGRSWQHPPWSLNIAYRLLLAFSGIGPGRATETQKSRLYARLALMDISLSHRRVLCSRLTLRSSAASMRVAHLALLVATAAARSPPSSGKLCSSAAPVEVVGAAEPFVLRLLGSETIMDLVRRIRPKRVLVFAGGVAGYIGFVWTQRRMQRIVSERHAAKRFREHEAAARARWIREHEDAARRPREHTRSPRETAVSALNSAFEAVGFVQQPLDAFQGVALSRLKALQRDFTDKRELLREYHLLQVRLGMRPSRPMKWLAPTMTEAELKERICTWRTEVAEKDKSKAHEQMVGRVEAALQLKGMKPPVGLRMSSVDELASFLELVRQGKYRDEY
jgi:hypothetical protein